MAVTVVELVKAPAETLWSLALIEREVASDIALDPRFLPAFRNRVNVVRNPQAPFVSQSQVYAPHL